TSDCFRAREGVTHASAAFEFSGYRYTRIHARHLCRRRFQRSAAASAGAGSVLLDYPHSEDLAQGPHRIKIAGIQQTWSAASYDPRSNAWTLCTTRVRE